MPARARRQTLSNIRKHFSRNPLPNEKLTLHQIFHPFKCIINFIGLFPYGIKFDDSKNRFKIISNSIYMNSVRAVSIVLVMYAFFFLHIQYIYNAEDVNSLTNVLITQLNYIAEVITLLGNCTVVYVCAFLYRQKYIKILNRISLIWSEIGCDNDLTILGHLRFEVNVITIGFLVITIVLQLCVNATRDDGFWKVVLVTFSFILPQTIQMISLAFFYVLVMMTVSLLTGINQRLLELHKKLRPGDLFLKFDMTLSYFPLRDIELAYGKVFELKCNINEAFQGVLLMTACQTFHCIVSEGYSIYHGLVARTHTVHNMINNTIWMAYQFLKIYSVAYSGNILITQAKQIGKTLHAIPTGKQDLRLLMEIQHFASSMQYQEFAMSVYGYFRLDSTLMATMVASVTMYLVIMVQFDKSSLNT